MGEESSSSSLGNHCREESGMIMLRAAKNESKHEECQHVHKVRDEKLHREIYIQKIETTVVLYSR
jgi:hypothetical protein